MTGPLRVGFVSHLSDLSGASRCLLLVLQLLDRGRFEPIAVCPGPGPLVQAISDLGIPVHIVAKFPPSRWWGMRFAALCFLAKLAYRLMYVARLYFLLRCSRVQVAFLNTLLSSGATIAARLSRLPVVTSLHEYRLRFSLTSPIRRWVVLHGAHHLITDSAAVKAVAVEYGANPSRITVAHTGIGGSRFVPPDSAAILAQRQMWGVSSSDVVFGAAGALVKNKGFQDLIAAAAEVSSALPGSRVVVAGSVPEGEDIDFPQRLKEQVTTLRLGEVARFLGQVANMPLFFSAIDVLVIPSHDDAFPVVALEAMSMGKPVIGTEAGGLVEIVVPETTGLLVPPHRPDELAAAMVRLGSDRVLRQRMGKDGAERVKTIFTQSAYIAAVEGVLESIMNVLGEM